MAGLARLVICAINLLLKIRWMATVAPHVPCQRILPRSSLAFLDRHDDDVMVDFKLVNVFHHKLPALAAMLIPLGLSTLQSLLFSGSIILHLLARLTVVRTAFTGTLIATVVDSGHNATSLTHRAIFLLRAAYS